MTQQVTDTLSDSIRDATDEAPPIAAEPLRILKCANIGPDPNTGVGRVMHETANALRKMGHSVDLMFDEDVARVGSGTRLDRFSFPVALVAAVRKRMRERHRYHVVEIHEPIAAYYCFRRCWGATDLPPCAIMSHGIEERAWQHHLELSGLHGKPTPLFNRIGTPLTRLSLARYGLGACDQVMCLNTSDRKFAIEECGLAPSRISLVTNGVSEAFAAGTDKPIRTRIAADRNEPLRILFVGSWLEKKGRREIAEAFAKLVARRSGSVRMSLLGTGVGVEQVLTSFAPEIRHLVQVLPVFGEEQLRVAHATHDIFVSAAFYEPWGLAALEAGAAGMPIVSTRTDGPRDIFVDGESALFVRRASADDLVSAVERVADNTELRAALSAGARKVAKRLTWQAAAESHLRAYARAIHGIAAG